MTKYRKKPIEVEAFLFGYEPIPKWFADACKLFGYTTYYNYQHTKSIEIHYPENDVRFNRGDYVIKGIEGEVYPCNSDIFKKTYEEVK
ncbi:hypothetical protein [Bacillus inaquosorum]|uniref:hypothetical protein n=1 Tax=Bacillus inaquosorum TaxID=483913 RepID=UPI00228269B6|nr:hypothetical protein [Bacillus inaquosorum]MCY8174519.1 hypothetical protein [Bacillus inaquosorum]